MQTPSPDSINDRNQTFTHGHETHRAVVVLLDAQLVSLASDSCARRIADDGLGRQQDLGRGRKTAHVGLYYGRSRPSS